MQRAEELPHVYGKNMDEAPRRLMRSLGRARLSLYENSSQPRGSVYSPLIRSLINKFGTPDIQTEHPESTQCEVITDGVTASWRQRSGEPVSVNFSPIKQTNYDPDDTRSMIGEQARVEVGQNGNLLTILGIHIADATVISRFHDVRVIGKSVGMFSSVRYRPGGGTLLPDALTVGIPSNDAPTDRAKDVQLSVDLADGGNNPAVRYSPPTVDQDDPYLVHQLSADGVDQQGEFVLVRAELFHTLFGKGSDKRSTRAPAHTHRRNVPIETEISPDVVNHLIRKALKYYL